MGMTIINNYEMPSNCYMCDLHNYHECDLTGESIEEDYCWNGDSREKHCPLREVEAIPKDQYEQRLKENNELINDLEELRTMINKFAESYENRLKADMVAMLTELQLEIEEKEKYYEAEFEEPSNRLHETAMCGRMFGYGGAKQIIQQKINALKENKGSE